MSVPGAVVGSQRFESLVARLVESGRYNSASEVLEAAVDALEREECDEEAKLAYLKQALEEGDASGDYEGDAFADVRRELGWEASAK